MWIWPRHEILPSLRARATLNLVPHRAAVSVDAAKAAQADHFIRTLARAFLADPVRDRTTFVIAHRLSTIRNADLLLMMENGRIVEKGTHQELLDAQGRYAELYQSQFTGRMLSEVGRP